MQTVNDKWKYKLQQLFEMLSLSLDTGLESFIHWSIALSAMVLFEISRDLKQSLLQLSQVACCCHGNHAVGTQPVLIRNKCRCIL